jgi:predicted methyltransferase
MTHSLLRRGGALIIALGLIVGAQAQMGPPAPKSEIAQRIEKALASDLRTAEERARDARERKPVQTLEFFGLQSNMTVVELVPGAGWYTKILGHVLDEQGKFHVAIGANRTAPRLKEWGFKNAVAIDDKLTTGGGAASEDYLKQGLGLPANSVDLVLTFRNLHNFEAPARTKINKAVFDALKPGGVFGVVDHTRRHNEPVSKENWRRIDPVIVIKEALDAGFVFEAFSDLHYRPDDELRYDTQRPSVAGYSDRFTFKFRKPAK